MQEIVFDNDKIYELKKIISTLEWDIDHIQNNKLKVLKEEKLKYFRRELRLLLEKTDIKS